MIPEYIIKLYEDEVRKTAFEMAVAILKNMNIEVDDDIKNKLNLKLKLVSEYDEFIKITKTRRNIPEKRCEARMSRKGVLVQCMRSYKGDDKKCSAHQKNNIHGTIHDTYPAEPNRRKNMD